MPKMDVKTALSEANNPFITCTKGHTYHVPHRFFDRNVRLARDFICPTCLVAFKVKKS
jgi:hypothetical protein